MQKYKHMHIKHPEHHVPFGHAQLCSNILPSNEEGIKKIRAHKTKKKKKKKFVSMYT